MFKKITITMLLLAVLLVALGVQAQEDSEFTANMLTVGVNSHPQTGEVRPIPDSSATLLTNEDGAWFTMETTELENGHVYTIWWVIMNNPEACAEERCAGSDVFGNPDGVAAELTLADTLLMDEEARVTLAGHLPVGEVERPWFGHGFTNPTGAQIWLVVNHHGPLIPDMAGNMLNTYRGGCEDESSSAGGMFPDSGVADGMAGPNICRLLQIAAFVQSDN